MSVDLGVDVMLFTDGGSSSGKNAAGACVLEDLSRHTRLCLAVYLGAATNNEAEITAALLGFSAIVALHGDQTQLKLHWVSDSEYVLKSATAYIKNWQKNGWMTADKKPVKNQGLWRTYLALTRKLTIKSEHVRGHTGHPENEACDQASQWARDCGMELDMGQSWVRSELDTPIGNDSWTCFDGRPLLESLRSEAADEDDPLALVRVLTTFFSGNDGAPTKSGDTQVSLRPIVLPLQQAHAAAIKLATRSEQAQEAADQIERLIRDLS